MKALRLIPFLVFFVLASCNSIQVASDYDSKTDFSTYKTYTYFKDGIDKSEISDLDKKRILNAIDTEMTLKGFSKSDKNPDVLINIFTQANQRVNVYNNYYSPWGGYYGWGWGPYWGPSYNNVSTSVEGILFIDILDSAKKELVWQGKGTGYLTRDRDKKEALIQEFVQKILKEFPPQK